MIGSLIILGKVATVCGAGFGIATALEWFTDIKVKPAKSIVQLGSNNKGGNENDNKIEHLKQRVRQQG